MSNDFLDYTNSCIIAVSIIVGFTSVLKIPAFQALSLIEKLFPLAGLLICFGVVVHDAFYPEAIPTKGTLFRSGVSMILIWFALFHRNRAGKYKK